MKFMSRISKAKILLDPHRLESYISYNKAINVLIIANLNSKMCVSEARIHNVKYTRFVQILSWYC